jgi:diguanylate cyclase (GGDEF)-like protein
MTIPDAWPELHPVSAAPRRTAAQSVISPEVGSEWVARSQDGEAGQVLAEIDREIGGGLDQRSYARALYARSLCQMVLGDAQAALRSAGELNDLCAELDLTAAGLQAQALLVHLLRSDGQIEQAVEQLAHAVALEPELRDLADPDVQSALGALAVALRLGGAVDEAGRVEQRLSAVEQRLPVHQRVSRWSNLAFDHLQQAMAPARKAPFQVDGELVARAVRAIENACALADWSTYEVVRIEGQVLGALPAALLGDAKTGITQLDACRAVLDRGAEASSAKVFWAVGMVRALVRLGRFHEATAIGVRVLSLVREAGKEADRATLAYEVMRAEHPQVERAGTGTAEYLALCENRVGADFVLVSALFRARVDLLRGADERRSLARAASLDLLTELVNRRGAASAIAEAAARPPGDSMALLLIDLDGFKDVNDTAGHLAGDEVLRRVSGALRTAARLEDVVARWGGDEFVVVAALDEERALALADRLRDTIRIKARVRGLSPVTGSIGVAVRNAPLDEHTWLRLADEAMYSAKRSGGDATVLG